MEKLDKKDIEELRQNLVKIKAIVVEIDPNDDSKKMREIWELATLSTEIIDVGFPTPTKIE